MKAKNIPHAAAGRHNSNLSQSVARVTRAASWKKQRVIRIKPAADMIAAVVAETHEALIYPPNQPVFRRLALGEEVGLAYSNAIAEMLAHPELRQWEFILTIEHDNGPPSDGLIKLIEDMEAHPEFACIGGLYWTKGDGGVAQIWGDPNDPQLNFRPQIPQPGKLQECCGTGMGFNLWRMSMFQDERIQRPWFRTKASREEGVGTQDLSFWTEARKYGYRCAIDNRVQVGHWDNANQIWW